MAKTLTEEFHYIECKDVNLLLHEMRKYINDEKIIDEVRHAYLYAENKHEGQMRKSGEAFIIHPLSTAYYLAQWKMGPKTIIAGLLHDVIEDTPVTRDEIEQIFGTDVANIVESVTKVSFFTKENRAQMKAKYLRKLFISMIRDIRVIIVKIADRMHNMLTLKYMKPEKQKIIAKETLDIYSTIAHRIGMKTAKNLLEDYSFRYLNPEEYNRVSALLEEDIEAREQIINEIIDSLDEKISNSDKLERFEVYGRSKTIYSIYRKMTLFGKNFTDINDIIAVRIITENIDECYTVMGWVHQMFTPLSGRFKDYIATPKNNLYQSLHTTVANKDGIIFEVQIRTFDMEDIAMHGAAAHWKYKAGEKNISVEEKQREIDEKVDMFTRIMNLEKLAAEGEEVEYESGMDKLEAEIEETVKSDYLTSLIYVLTPDGQVVTLPFGSTVLDFAYKIHSEVGNHTVGARVNGVFSPFNTTLESGEMIEVQTSTEIEPQEKWLKFVRTSTARRAIELYLAEKSQKVLREETISNQKLIRNTKREIDRYIIENDLKWKVNSLEEMKRKLLVLDYKNIDDFLLSIGKGDFSIKEAVEVVFIESTDEMNDDQILDIKTRKYKSTTSRGDIIINKIENLNSTLAECCYPLPLEPIAAFMSKAKGFQIHRSECINILNTKKVKNILEAVWSEQKVPNFTYKAKIRIITVVRPGVLQGIVQVLGSQRIEVVEAKLVTSEEELITRWTLIVEVKNSEHLNTAMTAINEVPGVETVVRASNVKDTLEGQA